MTTTKERRKTRIEKKCLFFNIVWNLIFFHSPDHTLFLSLPPLPTTPSSDSVEWHSGNSGHLTLQDDDVTSIISGVDGWKRLNTLVHYRVPEGATLALIQRQAPNGSLPRGKWNHILE